MKMLINLLCTQSKWFLICMIEPSNIHSLKFLAVFLITIFFQQFSWDFRCWMMFIPLLKQYKKVYTRLFWLSVFSFLFIHELKLHLVNEFTFATLMKIFSANCFFFEAYVMFLFDSFSKSCFHHILFFSNLLFQTNISILALKIK